MLIMKEYINIPSDEVYQIEDKNVHIHLIKSIEMRRKKAFLYFNDMIYIDYNHVTILNNINLTLIEKEQFIKYRLYRQKSLINTIHKISFGHILKGNIAVIDSYTNLNCNNEMIINSLLQYGFNKIYKSITSSIDIVDIYRIY